MRAALHLKDGLPLPRSPGSSPSINLEDTILMLKLGVNLFARRVSSPRRIRLDREKQLRTKNCKRDKNMFHGELFSAFRNESKNASQRAGKPRELQREDSAVITASV
jgi:hypothetical protein